MVVSARANAGSPDTRPALLPYLARRWLFARLSPLSEPLVGLCNQQQDLLGFGIGHRLGRRERFYGERSPTLSTCRHRSPSRI
jgi:hypothetical protein